jgi:hypothetical protein
MGKTITEKSARRWLKRNTSQIIKRELDIVGVDTSCFLKQLKLCRDVIAAADKEKETC